MPPAVKKIFETMGKVFRNLYEQVYNPLNLWWAYKAAARGKRYTP